MDLKERIVTLLTVAAAPQTVEAITSIVAPDREAEVLEAILDLSTSDAIRLDSGGIVLAEEGTSGDNDAVRKQGDDPDFDPEMSEETIPAETNTGIGALPQWPWPEYDDWPVEDSAPSDDDIEPERKDEQSDEASARPLRRTDSIDQLPTHTKTKTKLKNLGIQTVEDLIARLDWIRSQGVSAHVASNIMCALQEGSSKMLPCLESEQIEALGSESGCANFGFDLFGMLVSLDIAPAARKTTPQLPARNDVFFTDPEGLSKVVQDEVLVRRLRLGGILSLGDLLSKTDEELLSIRGFGAKKLAAVKAILERFSDQEDAETTPGGVSSDSHGSSSEQANGDQVLELIEQTRKALDPNQCLFWPKAFAIVMEPLAKEALQAHPDEPLRALIDSYWSLEGIDDMSKNAVSACLDRFAEAPDSSCRAITLPADAGWKPLVEELIDPLKHEYDPDAGVISKHTLSLREWLESGNPETMDLLRKRFLGATLEEAGLERGLTRERVRQIQRSVLSRRPPLQEDIYAHFVDAYSMTADDFCNVTGLDKTVYGYLTFIIGRHSTDRLPLVDAIEDEMVPGSVREKIANSDIEGYLIINGAQVPASKYAVTIALLSAAGDGKAVSLSWLMREYESVLKDNGKLDSNTLSPTSERAYGAWLARQPGILYAPLPKSIDPEDRSVRLYDDKHMDFDVLADYLESGEYSDIECSAALIYNSESFAEIRRQLDIRNEYELHAIIRRFCGDVEGLALGRTPMMQFGKADRGDQLKSLIAKLGPIVPAALSKAYEKEYGVDAFVVQMNYLKDASGYFDGEFYEIRGSSLSGDQMTLLKGLLVDDVLSLSRLRAAFGACYSETDTAEVNASALEQLGYSVRRGLVVRNGFDMASYAERLLDSNDRFKIGEGYFLEELPQDDDFRLILNMRLRNYSIVEIAPDEYESMSSLQRDFPEMSAELMTDYLDSFCEFLKQDEVETVMSVKLAGFHHVLHDIVRGTRLGDSFLEGVVAMGYVGGRLKRTRLNGKLIVSKRRGVLSVNEFVRCVANKFGTLEPKQLHAILRDHYGVRISGGHLRSILDKVGDSIQLDSSELAAELSPQIPQQQIPDVIPADDLGNDSELLCAIEEVVSKRARMPVARLMNQLQSQYGIQMTAVQLRAALKKAHVSFDETRDFVSALAV